jgi:periplasmic copper chaperone A
MPIMPKPATALRTLFVALALLAVIEAPASGRDKSTSDVRVGTLRLEHPWAPPAPTGARVAPAYVVIHNSSPFAAPTGARVAPAYVVIHTSSPFADRLTAASAGIARRMEIRETVTRDGIVSTRPLAGGLPIPANGSVTLKADSYQLVLVDPNRPLKAGDRVSTTLTFANMGTISVIFPVEVPGAPPPPKQQKPERR